jgi:ArsR family transcriptional regulator, arsenate/arsenite/antimonite-responsive transcriptional repressor
MNDDKHKACCCRPPELVEDSRPTEGREADEELAAFAKALGHPARVEILRILGARSTCACGEIVRDLPLAQSTVSEHLRILKKAGLIVGEVDGPRVSYCVDPNALRRLKRLVEGLQQAGGDTASSSTVH